MKLHLHQDVLGHKADTDAEVDGTQAEWLIREGYASVADSEDEYAQEDKHLVTSADAEDDPTLAANREAPNDFDAAEAEDEAENGDAQKLAEAKAGAPVRTTGGTQKRDSATPDESAGTADDKVVYDGGDAPTAGAQAVPVDPSAPAPAVADVRKDSADDSKASEA